MSKPENNSPSQPDGDVFMHSEPKLAPPREENNATSENKNIKNVVLSGGYYDPKSQGAASNRLISEDVGGMFGFRTRLGTFTDNARLVIAKQIISIFSWFLSSIILYWVIFAAVSIYAGPEAAAIKEILKEFRVFAEIVFTSLVSIVSAATGFYFGSNANDGAGKST